MKIITKLNNLKMETEKTIIKLFQTYHISQIAKICNNPNLSKNLLNMPYPFTIKNAKAWVKNSKKLLKIGNSLSFAIIEKHNNELIGSIALENLNKTHRNAEISYWIDEKNWNKGYATEVLKAVVEFGFKKINLHRIIGKCYVENIASAKVMEKCGFVFEGTLKEHYFKLDKYKDIKMYAIINKNC